MVKQRLSSKASYLSLSTEYKGYKNEHNAKLHTNHSHVKHPAITACFFASLTESVLFKACFHPSPLLLFLRLQRNEHSCSCLLSFFSEAQKRLKKRWTDIKKRPKKKKKPGVLGMS